MNITPSLMFQNKQQNDLSTYWPAYSNPGAGQFNNATPERIPIPDEYYLPALKIQVDFAHVTFISNSSYYHRNETDSYQGTVYDLAFYQALGWPNALDPGPRTRLRSAVDHNDGAVFLVSAAQCHRDPSAAGLHQLRDAEHHDQPAADLDAGVPLAIDRQRQPLEVDRGRVLVARAGAQHRAAQRSRRSSSSFRRSTAQPHAPDSLFGPYYYCNGQGTPQPAQYPDSELRHLLQLQQELRPADCRFRRGNLQAHRPPGG